MNTELGGYCLHHILSNASCLWLWHYASNFGFRPKVLLHFRRNIQFRPKIQCCFDTTFSFGWKWSVRFRSTSTPVNSAIQEASISNLRAFYLKLTFVKRDWFGALQSEYKKMMWFKFSNPQLQRCCCDYLITDHFEIGGYFRILVWRETWKHYWLIESPDKK